MYVHFLPRPAIDGRHRRPLELLCASCFHSPAMPLSQQEFANEDDSALFQSIKVKDWERVRGLINQATACAEQSFLRELDIYDNTALHAAIGYQAPDDILLALLEEYPEATMMHGANEWLPLHVAAMWGCSPIVMTAIIQVYPAGLDDRGERGNKGRTPRHFKDRFPHNKDLLERSTEEWTAIISLRSGAGVNAF
jgi:hypothetical protein